MKRRYLPAPFYGVLILPFGLCIGYASVALPYVLRLRGFEVGVLGAALALAKLPHVYKFLWGPSLDAGWRRRSWYLGAVAVTALSLALATLILPTPDARIGPFAQLTAFTAVLTLAQAAVATVSLSVLSLVASTVPPEIKGKVSGWQTSGNLAGTALGGALMEQLIEHCAASTVITVLFVLLAACTVPVFFIDEPSPPKQPLFRLLLDLLKDLWKTLKARDGWTGLLICISPVGAGALTELFSAMAVDYAPDKASSENLVQLVNGLFGALFSAAGALAGGWLADRMNRRLGYLLSGAVTALVAVMMLMRPATPAWFTVGCLAYMFMNGVAFAAFYAFVYDMVGQKSGVGTKLALFIGVSNFPISYVTWLDSRAYDAAKAAGLPGRYGALGMDALSTFAGIAILAAVTYFLRRSKPVLSTAETPAVT